jgi:hypothetical protein
MEAELDRLGRKSVRAVQVNSEKRERRHLPSTYRCSFRLIKDRKLDLVDSAGEERGRSG